MIRRGHVSEFGEEHVEHGRLVLGAVPGGETAGACDIVIVMPGGGVPADRQASAPYRVSGYQVLAYLNRSTLASADEPWVSSCRGHDPMRTQA